MATVVRFDSPGAVRSIVWRMGHLRSALPARISSSPDTNFSDEPKQFHAAQAAGLKGGFDYTAHASSSGDTRTVAIDQQEGKVGKGRLTITVKNGKITDFQMQKWKKIRLLTLIPLGSHEFIDDHVRGLRKVD